MTDLPLCPIHGEAVRRALHDDPTLGCGNFLDRVLAQPIERDLPLFVLDRPWQGPTGEAHARLSLAALGRVVDELGSWYLGQKVRPGQIVCTYVQEGIAQFLHAVALIRIGAIAAPVNWRMPPEIVRLYCDKYGFDALVIDEHPNAAAVDNRPGLVLIDAAPGKGSALNAGAAIVSFGSGTGADDRLVMLCHSSGTTGVPKAVEFAHQQFFAGKRERLLGFVNGPNERMISALPHSHSAGFSYLMTAVMTGLPTLVCADTCDPRLADKAHAFEATIIAAFSQSYAAIAAAAPPVGSLPHLKRAFNTGDTAHRAHIEALIAAAPDLAFNDGFGASELGMALFCGVTDARSGGPPARRIGRPVSFAEARIIDETGAVLPDGTIGYFAIKSPTITPGYYRDPLLTRLCRTGDGHWLTGDVGYRDADGWFYQIDRAVDIIQSPRGPVYSLALEEALLATGAVEDVSVIGVPLTPRASQMVVAFADLEVGGAKGAVDASRCRDLLDALDTAVNRDRAHKVPVAVVDQKLAGSRFVGATGKVLKRLLRNEFWQHYTAFLNGDRALIADVAIRHL